METGRVLFNDSLSKSFKHHALNQTKNKQHEGPKAQETGRLFLVERIRKKVLSITEATRKKKSQSMRNWP